MLSMTAAGLLVAASLSAQRHAPPPAGQFRLAQVRSVFVEPLGGGEAANLVHDQLVAALLNRTNLRVESGPSLADARLTGAATVRSGEAHWLVGSAASSAAAAAVLLRPARPVSLILRVGAARSASPNSAWFWPIVKGVFSGPMTAHVAWIRRHSCLSAFYGANRRRLALRRSLLGLSIRVGTRVATVTKDFAAAALPIESR